LAISEWLLQAGKYSPEWQDNDSDLTLRDLLNSQQVAISLTNDPDCKWSLSDVVLPISSRIGGEFYFVMTDTGDDPPVYHFLESAVYPTRINISFTSYIRERMLSLIDLGFRQQATRKLTSSREKEVVSIINEQYPIFEQMRKDFTERIYTEDIVKRHITGPTEFQTRWVDEIRWLAVTHELTKQQIHVPWNWN